MARRLGAYQAKSGGLDAMEALSAKLSADLRSGVQALARLAAGDIPKTEQHKASGRTLWEGEEVALRYVLEDGKLNVCLRNLVEWRRYCKERRHEDHADEAASVREGLDAFEKGMGTVLRNAWNHTEALQTTDIPLLVQYISEVIKDAAAEPERVAEMSRAGDLKDRQEVVCLSYLRGLLSRLGEHEEERVMPMLRSAGIAADLAAMLHANHMHLGEEGRAAGAEALARMCGTEDFRTYRDEYIRDVDKAILVSMKTDFIGEICKDPAQRRALRPLLDVISYCERSCPRK